MYYFFDGLFLMLAVAPLFYTGGGIVTHFHCGGKNANTQSKSQAILKEVLITV